MLEDYTDYGATEQDETQAGLRSLTWRGFSGDQENLSHVLRSLSSSVVARLSAKKHLHVFKECFLHFEIVSHYRSRWGKQMDGGEEKFRSEFKANGKRASQDPRTFGAFVCALFPCNLADFFPPLLFSSPLQRFLKRTEKPTLFCLTSETFYRRRARGTIASRNANLHSETKPGCGAIGPWPPTSDT